MGIIDAEEVGGETARRAAPWDGASTASPIPPQSPPSRSSRGETRDCGVSGRGPRTRRQGVPCPTSAQGRVRGAPSLCWLSPRAQRTPARGQAAFLGHRDPRGRELRLPGSQHRLPGGPGPGRRWRAAPGPTKTSPRHASRPASVSLTPQECRNPRYQPRSTPDLNDFQRTELTLAAEPSPRPAGRP